MIEMASVTFGMAANAPATAQAGVAEYKRAAHLFTSFNNDIEHASLNPNWIKGTDRFWYLDNYHGQHTFTLVDARNGTSAPAFDHARLAAALGHAAGASIKAEALPFTRFDFVDDGKTIVFTVGAAGFRCTLADYSCSPAPAPIKQTEMVSPDGRRAVFVRDYNLWLRETATDQEVQLTSDGAEDYSYNINLAANAITARLFKVSAVPNILFSGDSKTILAWRTDQRKVRRLTIEETVMGGVPKLHTFPFPIVGDKEIPLTTPMVIDLDSRKITPVQTPAIERYIDQQLMMRWDPVSRKFAFNENPRGAKTIKVHLVDPSTGAMTTPLTETSPTFITPSSTISLVYNFDFVSGNLFWMSDRDGWMHIYRIDAQTGKVTNQVTKGDWVVRKIIQVDPHTKTIYFTAAGKSAGEDPYQRSLYRVHFDGSGLQRLTPEDADHEVSISPDNSYFTDTFSRPDLSPVTVLRRTDGKLVRELQRADITKLVAAGWKNPERFKVKAADGRTDLYGVLYRPSNFDPAKRYPVVDSIYPGPFIIRAPKAFGQALANEDSALAELGFIVMAMDGRGTVLRSKAFLDRVRGNLGIAGSLDDHIAALKQLASRHPEIDIDRVGITGHSAGGYASARAMLVYPDFFKVAVAVSGAYDWRGYLAGWGEDYVGYNVPAEKYEEISNLPLASHLQGKLLLVHGSMDDNSLPDQTLQMANALIHANKDFDMLIIPNVNHGLIDISDGLKNIRSNAANYGERRKWDYFVQHLAGATPPPEFDFRSADAAKVDPQKASATSTNPSR